MKLIDLDKIRKEIEIYEKHQKWLTDDIYKGNNPSQAKHIYLQELIQEKNALITFLKLSPKFTEDIKENPKSDKKVIEVKVVERFRDDGSKKCVDKEGNIYFFEFKIGRQSLRGDLRDFYDITTGHDGNFVPNNIDFKIVENF